jgi:alkanesulfonate monooxygenase SsuD/methylene tetrahydromethanopterin reductase-like flavin-dependent oxidoreductase (luciferase family)
MEEQMGLLRKYWSEELVSFEGRYDRADHVALNPRPNRLIPIWLGSEGRAALERVGRLGDGWVTRGGRPAVGGDDWEAKTLRRRAAILAAAVAAGRDPQAIAICIGVERGETPAATASNVAYNTALGATHSTVSPTPSLASPQEHLAAATTLARELGLGTAARV